MIGALRAERKELAVETRANNRLITRLITTLIKMKSAGAKAVFRAAATVSLRLDGVGPLLGLLLVTFCLPASLRAQDVITTVAGDVGGVNVAGASFNLPTGVAVDSLGDLFVADANNCVVWEISNGVSTAISGIQGNCTPGAGSGALQSLAHPIDVAFCGNNLYFATHGYDPLLSGQSITTAIAGGVYEISNNGFSTLPMPPTPVGSTSPLFPVALACDGDGDVYIASYFYPPSVLPAGSVDEIPVGSQTTKNLVQQPGTVYSGVTVDSDNNVFVLASTGVSQGWLGTTLSGETGFIDRVSNGATTPAFTVDDGFPNTSRLISNGLGNFLLTIAASDTKPTVFVQAAPGNVVAGNGIAGFKDGVQATLGELNNATGLAVDACGSIYVADSGNNVIRKILNPDTAGTSACASGASPSGPSPTLYASLNSVQGNGQITAPGSVTFYSTEGIQNCTTQCTTALGGEVFFCSFSTASYISATSTDSVPCEGGATLAAVAVSPTGNTSGNASDQAPFLIAGTYYVVAEYFNPPYLPVTTGYVTVTVCGASCTDSGVPNIPVASVPVALTPGALSVSPNGGNGIVALDAKSNEYFLNSSAGTVVLVDKNSGGGTIVSPSTAISTGGTLGPMNNLGDMVIGSDGNLYVTDTGNNRVIQVVNPSSASPTVSVINIGSSGGTLSPPLTAPMGIFETSDEVYVTDAPASGPRLVAFRPDGSYPTTVLSSTTSGAPTLGQLLGIAVNPTTLAIYVANSPAAGSSSGGSIIKTTIGGTPSVVSTPGLTLQSPYGIAMDASGGLYFSDTGSHLVYRMDVHSNVIVIAGNMTAIERLGDSLLAETAVSAVQTGLANPTWLALDASNSIYILDGSNLLYLDVTQSIVDFTATGQSQTIFVTNPVAGTQGSVEMEFGSPILNGADSSDFSVAAGTTCSQTSSTLLSPNTSCKLVVTLNSDSNDAAVTSCTLSEIEVSLGPPLTAGACPTPTTGPPPGLTAQTIHLDAVTPPATTLQVTGAAITGTYNLPYGPVQFLVTGGSGQYTFSETGLLPSGMSLSPTGILSGTPTQGGAFPFIVNVTDSQGDTGGLTQSLVINPAATTTTLTATPNSLGVSQPFTLTATVLYNGTPVTSSNMAFYDYNGATLGVVPLNGSGQASLAATSPATGGTYAYTATFQSTANLATSSGPANVTVTAISTTPVCACVTETILVTDSPTFPDIFDPEAIAVTDTPLIVPMPAPLSFALPVAYYSVGSVGFGTVAPGQTATQSFSLSNIGQGQLTLNGESVSGSAFSLAQIQCSNGASSGGTSLSTTLPPSGACVFTISYTAPTGAAPTGAIVFTDSASLSNVTSTGSQSTYVQSIALNGSGTSTSPGAPPQMMVPVNAPETILVVDQPSNTVSQTIRFTTPPPPTAKSGDSFTVVAVGGASGNPVTFSVGAGSVCTLSGATYTMTSDTGYCNVVANQAGGGIYTPAPPVIETVTAVRTVIRIAPTVTFTGAPTSSVYLSTFNVATTQNSGIIPTIRSTTGSICTISGNVVTMVSGTGTCTLRAAWTGDDYYLPTSLTQSTSATLLGTSTAITSTATLTPKNPLKVTVYFTVSNGTSTAVKGNVTVTASSGETCMGTVASGKCLLTFAAADAGPQTLTATYVGNADDSTSTSVSFALTVN
jgi:sugar lactone lactonase YvrE